MDRRTAEKAVVARYYACLLGKSRGKRGAKRKLRACAWAANANNGKLSEKPHSAGGSRHVKPCSPGVKSCDDDNDDRVGSSIYPGSHSSDDQDNADADFRPYSPGVKSCDDDNDDRVGSLVSDDRVGSPVSPGSHSIVDQDNAGADFRPHSPGVKSCDDDNDDRVGSSIHPGSHSSDYEDNVDADFEPYVNSSDDQDNADADFRPHSHGVKSCDDDNDDRVGSPISPGSHSSDDEDNAVKDNAGADFRPHSPGVKSCDDDNDDHVGSPVSPGSHSIVDQDNAGADFRPYSPGVKSCDDDNDDHVGSSIYPGSHSSDYEDNANVDFEPYVDSSDDQDNAGADFRPHSHGVKSCDDDNDDHVGSPVSPGSDSSDDQDNADADFRPHSPGVKSRDDDNDDRVGSPISPGSDSSDDEDNADADFEPYLDSSDDQDNAGADFRPHSPVVKNCDDDNDDRVGSPISPGSDSSDDEDNSDANSPVGSGLLAKVCARRCSGSSKSWDSVDSSAATRSLLIDFLCAHPKKVPRVDDTDDSHDECDEDEAGQLGSKRTTANVGYSRKELGELVPASTKLSKQDWTQLAQSPSVRRTRGGGPGNPWYYSYHDESDEDEIPISDYERQRLANIARNNKKLRELGLGDCILPPSSTKHLKRQTSESPRRQPTQKTWRSQRVKQISGRCDGPSLRPSCDKHLKHQTFERLQRQTTQKTWRSQRVKQISYTYSPISPRSDSSDDEDNADANSPVGSGRCDGPSLRPSCDKHLKHQTFERLQRQTTQKTRRSQRVKQISYTCTGPSATIQVTPHEALESFADERWQSIVSVAERKASLNGCSIAMLLCEACSASAKWSSHGVWLCSNCKVQNVSPKCSQCLCSRQVGQVQRPQLELKPPARIQHGRYGKMGATGSIRETTISRLVQDLNDKWHVRFGPGVVTIQRGARATSLIVSLPTECIDNHWLHDVGLSPWNHDHWGVEFLYGEAFQKHIKQYGSFRQGRRCGDVVELSEFGYRGLGSVFGLGTLHGMVASSSANLIGHDAHCQGLIVRNTRATKPTYPPAPGARVHVGVSIHVAEEHHASTSGCSRDRSPEFTFFQDKSDVEAHKPSDAIKLLVEASFDLDDEGAPKSIWIVPSYALLQHTRDGVRAVSQSQHYPYVAQVGQVEDALLQNVLLVLGHRPKLELPFHGADTLSMAQLFGQCTLPHKRLYGDQSAIAVCVLLCIENGMTHPYWYLLTHVDLYSYAGRTFDIRFDLANGVQQTSQQVLQRRNRGGRPAGKRVKCPALPPPPPVGEDWFVRFSHTEDLHSLSAALASSEPYRYSDLHRLPDERDERDEANTSATTIDAGGGMSAHLTAAHIQKPLKEPRTDTHVRRHLHVARMLLEVGDAMLWSRDWCPHKRLSNIIGSTFPNGKPSVPRGTLICTDQVSDEMLYEGLVPTSLAMMKILAMGHAGLDAKTGRRSESIRSHPKFESLNSDSIVPYMKVLVEASAAILGRTYEYLWYTVRYRDRNSQPISLQKAFTGFVSDYIKVEATPSRKHRAGVAFMQSDLICVMRDSIAANPEVAKRLNGSELSDDLVAQLPAYETYLWIGDQLGVCLGWRQMPTLCWQWKYLNMWLHQDGLVSIEPDHPSWSVKNADAEHETTRVNGTSTLRDASIAKFNQGTQTANLMVSDSCKICDLVANLISLACVEGRIDRAKIDNREQREEFLCGAPKQKLTFAHEDDYVVALPDVHSNCLHTIAQWRSRLPGSTHGPEKYGTVVNRTADESRKSYWDRCKRMGKARAKEFGERWKQFLLDRGIAEANPHMNRAGFGVESLLRALALGKGHVPDSFWQLVTTDNMVWQSKTDASRYMRAAFNVGYDADLRQVKRDHLTRLWDLRIRSKAWAEKHGVLAKDKSGALLGTCVAQHAQAAYYMNSLLYSRDNTDADSLFTYDRQDALLRAQRQAFGASFVSPGGPLLRKRAELVDSVVDKLSSAAEDVFAHLKKVPWVADCEEPDAWVASTDVTQPPKQYIHRLIPPDEQCTKYINCLTMLLRRLNGHVYGEIDVAQRAKAALHYSYTSFDRWVDAQRALHYQEYARKRRHDQVGDCRRIRRHPGL